MRIRRRWWALAVVALVAGLVPAPGLADHSTRDSSSNLDFYGHVEHPADFLDTPAHQRVVNSDLAFWGDLLVNGNYNGFRLIDISDPQNPELIHWYNDCNGDQGDVMVWENLVIRSWNSPAPDPAGETGRTCGGAPVPQGWEGLHVFDIGDPMSPAWTPTEIDLVASVEITNASMEALFGAGVTGCGSHTATLVPDTANNRLLVYNSGSNSACPQIEIVEIPLNNPAGAAVLRRERAGRQCHDTSVFLGDVLRAVCAGGDGFTVWTMDPADNASLEDPRIMYAKPMTDHGVTIGHSAAFTWDGKRFIFGHEPGGGAGARCKESDPDDDKTFFYYDVETGKQIGKWVLTRPQGPTENCTLHNFNFVPTSDGRDILVSGNYQAGLLVVDFTNPASPQLIAYSDPAPLDETTLKLGGAWSTYWYNGYIYESDITKGLHVFGLNDPAVANWLPEEFSNPQTQMERISRERSADSEVSLRIARKRFRGRVESTASVCEARRQVLIKKARKGKRDTIVRRTRTQAGGVYAAKLRGKGTFYAEVRRLIVAEDNVSTTCRPGRSRNVRRR